MQHLGSAEGVFALASLNGLDATATLSAGQALALPEVIDKRARRILEGYVPASTEAGEESVPNWYAVRLDISARRSDLVTVQPRQSLYDLALQYGGDMETVWQLALLNGITVTAELDAGTVLIMPPAMNADTVRYFEEGRYVPASEDEGRLDGIDYWMVRLEFEVQ